MAYVRRKGNQLAIVHGSRNSETKKVEQKTLFCLYSKAEALAAVGKQQAHFRSMLKQDNPNVRFEWPKLEAGIREHLEHLPDLYNYTRTRVDDRFRSGLRDFARELLCTDPQLLLSSARVLQRNRHELSYLRDLIDFRLSLCEQDSTQWNQDNPFFWRTASTRRDVPPDEWEKLAALYGQQEYDEAKALAQLLTECWPKFARGFNYLGLIALKRDELDVAIGHFDEAARVGRTCFPKRIPKSQYWGDHETRPYIRALVYKAQGLNQRGDYGEALVLCEKLETECGQDVFAALERTPIYLNSGLWQPAIQSARFVHETYPQENFGLAFAYLEDGNRDDAVVHFLHAAILFPRTARMLTGAPRGPLPTASEEVEDHNTGVKMLASLETYLGGAGANAKRFFKHLIIADGVVAAIDEMIDARERWTTERGGDAGRANHDRMTEMAKLAFARKKVVSLGLVT